MKNTSASCFTYVTYIRTTPAKLWSALTNPKFVAQYWLGMRPEADWKVGGSWQLVSPDGEVWDAGEITEYKPKRRLTIHWRHQMNAELKAEGWTQCTMTLEPNGKTVKLTVTHSIERKNSKFIEAVAGGWPQILSNLKSLLETGSVIMPSRYGRPKRAGSSRSKRRTAKRARN